MTRVSTFSIFLVRGYRRNQKGRKIKERSAFNLDQTEKKSASAETLIL
jgi:hypothetical protein